MRANKWYFTENIIDELLVCLSGRYWCRFDFEIDIPFFLCFFFLVWSKTEVVDVICIFSIDNAMTFDLIWWLSSFCYRVKIAIYKVFNVLYGINATLLLSHFLFTTLEWYSTDRTISIYIYKYRSIDIDSNKLTIFRIFRMHLMELTIRIFRV